MCTAMPCLEIKRYEQRAEAAPAACFSWHPETGRTGLQRNAVYLVRPDGYVALANPEGSAKAVTTYLDARKLTPDKIEYRFEDGPLVQRSKTRLNSCRGSS